MTTHPEQPVHDLAIRLDEENRRLREALAAARRECEGLRAMVEKCRAWFVLDDSALGLMEWDMADLCTAALTAPAAGEEEKLDG